MPTYRFQEVPLYANKTVTCFGGCGKKLRRQRKFCQTINPFNKDENGRPKTSQQIYAELSEEAKQWKAAPETCRDCA
jgi:predicted unusual protein kinase regulating ubiquinone biosynthesis (AarF/ABC1/UbiB family)